MKNENLPYPVLRGTPFCHLRIRPSSKNQPFYFDFEKLKNPSSIFGPEERETFSHLLSPIFGPQQRRTTSICDLRFLRSACRSAFYSFPNMPCMKKVYKDKKRRCIAQLPGTKSGCRPADKPLINRLPTGRQPDVLFLPRFV